MKSYLVRREVEEEKVLLGFRRKVKTYTLDVQMGAAVLMSSNFFKERADFFTNLKVLHPHLVTEAKYRLLHDGYSESELEKVNPKLLRKRI